MAKDKQHEVLTANRLQKFKIEQRHKTIRTTIISGSAVAATYIIANAVVKLMDKPPWVQGLALLVSVLVAGGIQTPIFLRIKSYIGRWTHANLDRQSRLEAMIDPQRTGTGLRSDGSEPEELAP